MVDATTGPEPPSSTDEPVGGTAPGTEPITEPGNKPGNEPITEPGNKPSTEPGNEPSTEPGNDAVIALNDAAAVYAALAAGIRGAAVGWPAGAVARLERELFERFGDELGGSRPVGELVKLATDNPGAAA